jgi:hypothetical protein
MVKWVGGDGQRERGREGIGRAMWFWWILVLFKRLPVFFKYALGRTEERQRRKGERD